MKYLNEKLEDVGRLPMIDFLQKVSEKSLAQNKMLAQLYRCNRVYSSAGVANYYREIIARSQLMPSEAA